MMHKTKARLLIVVQPSANHYREPFAWELLNDGRVEVILFGRYNHRDQAPKRKAYSPLQASSALLRLIHRLEVKKIGGWLTWERGLFLKALKEEADLYVLPGNVYNLTTWALAISLRLRDKKIAFWGHGWKRPESGPKLSLRKLFYKLADAHFVYGTEAIKYAQSAGLKESAFYPIYNSFTSEKLLLDVLKRSVDKPVKPKVSNEVTLVFSGRLTKRHRVDLALQAVLELRAAEQLDLSLVVVGDGPERPALEEMAHVDRGAAHFLGAIHSLDDLYDIYREADYAVSPGASGLNVVQALCFHVPVIASVGDPESGPELEVIK